MINCFPWKVPRVILLCQTICDNWEYSIERLGGCVIPVKVWKWYPLLHVVSNMVFLVWLLRIHFKVFSESFQTSAVWGTTQIPPPLRRVLFYPLWCFSSTILDIQIMFQAHHQMVHSLRIKLMPLHSPQNSLNLPATSLDPVFLLLTFLASSMLPTFTATGTHWLACCSW